MSRRVVNITGNGVSFFFGGGGRAAELIESPAFWWTVRNALEWVTDLLFGSRVNKRRDIRMVGRKMDSQKRGVSPARDRWSIVGAFNPASSRRRVAFRSCDRQQSTAEQQLVPVTTKRPLEKVRFYCAVCTSSQGGKKKTDGSTIYLSLFKYRQWPAATVRMYVNITLCAPLRVTINIIMVIIRGEKEEEEEGEEDTYPRGYCHIAAILGGTKACSWPPNVSK